MLTKSLQTVDWTGLISRKKIKGDVFLYIFPPLKKGLLIRRYKRFFADILPNESEQEIVAHNPNTGSMKSLLNEGNIPINNKCLYSTSDNKKRKLHYTLEAICVNNEWVISNTIRVNSIIERAIKEKYIKGLEQFTSIRREYPFLDSKIDFYLESSVPTLVEVKSVTYFDENCCYFPDSITERGLKHLNTLTKAVESGYRAVMLYVCMVKRNDFKVAEHIDPKYANGLEQAMQRGVEKIVVHCNYQEISNTATISEYYTN